jgi:glutathione synthase/RimK-type ligase-like ATP-grasp enzyme
MIVLWGSLGDAPLAAVHAALVGRRAPVMLIDPRSEPHMALEMSVDPRLRGTLRVGATQVGLDQLVGIYLRPTAPARDALRAEIHERLWSLCEIAPALVLNRPAAMAGNGSKPYQAAQARAVGFATPDTLVTTSPQAARAFAAEHGDVIYKSTSGVRSIVAALDASDGERLADLESCPTQLQQRVTGVDVRVHVVGSQLFACELRSDAVDYRYAGRHDLDVTLHPIELAPDVASRCLALAALTELPLAGIDLRRTSEGEWYCFEINPSPGFTYYADQTGQPIAEAVAGLLLAA